MSIIYVVKVVNYIVIIVAAIAGLWVGWKVFNLTDCPVIALAVIALIIGGSWFMCKMAMEKILVYLA